MMTEKSDSEQKTKNIWATFYVQLHIEAQRLREMMQQVEAAKSVEVDATEFQPETTTKVAAAPKPTAKVTTSTS